MKATGVVRRIDDLVRVVIPKDIRRSLRIKEGDPLEIFTDKEGEFVFGPLCPGKEYALQIWVNDTKKVKICAKCHHEGKCLKGNKWDKSDCFIDEKHEPCKKCDKKDGFLKEEDFKDINF